MNAADYRKYLEKHTKPKVERKEAPPSLLSSQKDELTLPHVLACVTINSKAQHVHYDEGGGRILFSHEGVKYEVTVRPLPL